MRKFTISAPPPERLTVPQFVPVKLPSVHFQKGEGFGPQHDARIKADAAERAAATQPTPRRERQRPRNGPGLYVVESPLGPRKGRIVLNFTAATSATMSAAMGTISLQIDRGSIVWTRLENGLLALAADHDPEARLMGRITSATVRPGDLAMTAEVGQTPIARALYSEIQDGIRTGFSPGFLVHGTEMLDDGDADYDPGYMLQMRVTKWEPYECSATAIPRNPAAILKRRFQMSMTSATRTHEPELVSTDDPLGLSLAAGRVALASGQGSRVQRERLSKFFAAYDDAVLDGKTRDEAARTAALAVKAKV